MPMYLAVFRSRAEALDFASRLKREGVPASAVSTPQEAGAGCGLSVKVGAFDLSRARRALRSARYVAFAGFFRVETGFGRTIVRPV